MLCEICNKNKAVIHYAEVIDGKVKKLNLCEECSMSKGIGIQPPFSIGEILSGLTPPSFMSKVVEKTACPLCKMTFLQFRNTGRFGCSKCYEIFQKSLPSILGNIHKSTKHVGKVPARGAMVPDTVSKIRELEARLQQAVEKEEYELAAKIRDEMRALEKEEQIKAKKKRGKT